MALPAFASIEDLEARMGPMSDPARAQAALDDASALIRAEAGETWVDDDGTLAADVPGVLLTICCKAARRSLANPDGVTSESIEDYSVSFGNTSPDVYLTKAERAMVRRAAGRNSVGTLATSRGNLETAAVYHPGDVWPEEDLETLRNRLA